jgi:hypothetical protein
MSISMIFSMAMRHRLLVAARWLASELNALDGLRASAPAQSR